MPRIREEEALAQKAPKGASTSCLGMENRILLSSYPEVGGIGLEVGQVGWRSLKIIRFRGEGNSFWSENRKQLKAGGFLLTKFQSFSTP